MIYKISIPLLVFFLLVTLIHAAQPDSTIDYNVQTAQFRINDSLNLAEIYFGIPRNRLLFVERDSTLFAEFEISVRVLKDRRELSKQTWRSGSVARSQDEIRASQILFSMTSFQMKAGDYYIETNLKDLNSANHGARNFDLEIEAFDTKTLTLSEIELAASLKRDTQPGRFNKNGYQVIPNPGALYGDGLPLLMFYAEIYHLTLPSDTTYTVSYQILETGGNVVKTFPAKEKKIVGASHVEVGGFNVISIPSGSYQFVLEVKDNGSGAVARKSSRFFVYRVKDRQLAVRRPTEDAILEAMNYLYKDKSEKELDQEFESAQWLANKAEANVFKGLDFDGKKKFLIRFWYHRDRDTTSVINEFRDDYMKRVRYTEENFGGFKSGWLTDRGRVLLLYGTPDEIENFPSSNDLRAYQIWHYFSLEGGVKFYFVDLRGWGEFEQIHSTARNELNDPDWQRWLQPTR
ncbi:MAG: GWxTD domain-containing protein [bacterium]